MVNGMSMVEDQVHILGQIVAAAKRESVDALLVAGDIYDKASPSAEAVAMFDSFLTELAAEGIRVLGIPGNHDSAERVAYVQGLLESQGVCFPPVFAGEVSVVELQDEHGPVSFWLLPFLKPGDVRRYFPEIEIGDDYAAALRAVRDLFVPDVSDAGLQRIGATLGADIPYCVTGGTQLSEGIGEILTVLPDAPQCGLVICKPSFGVSTAEVYRKYDGLGPVRHPDIDAQIGAIERGDLWGMAEQCVNVLEEVTGAMYPEIGEIERFFESRGAVVSRMSGSGPTVFSVFTDSEQADKAAESYMATDRGQRCQVFSTRFIYRI